MTDDVLTSGLGADSDDGGGDGLPIGLIVRLALAGLVVAALVVFVLQNLDTVPVNFLSWSFDFPLIVLLAGAAVAGLLFRWLVRFWLGRRNRS